MASPAFIKTPSSRSIYLHVEKKDALNYKADVLALKYAQNLYGADKAAVKALSPKLPAIGEDLPRPGDFRLMNSLGQVGYSGVVLRNSSLV